MIINANTKIAAILKENPKALDAIISIRKKFEKLRNPLLRKLMAPRTSLAAASVFGGCTLDDFFSTLEPLGFEIDRNTKAAKKDKKPIPAFIGSLGKEQLIDLDVRPVIQAGRDPLNIIMEKLKQVQPAQVLKIVNSFEPTPLINLLEKRGFETYVDRTSENLVETYFFKSKKTDPAEEVNKQSSGNDWDSLLKTFEGKSREADVRHLEMPQPMHDILDALDHLPAGFALYVYHKRIPVFLLPELAERGFDYRIKEISDGNVHLLIFKN
jgi:uncharacterized protein (DUF2249 family)